MTAVLAVFGSLAATVYVLGAAAMAYLTAKRLPGWLWEHPALLGGPVRRALIIASIVPFWPSLLIALGCVLFHDRHRCPWGECSSWGWRVPGAPGVQALISVYRCPHRRTSRPLAVLRPQAASDPEAGAGSSRCDWYSGLLAVLMATGLGALASVPVPGPGFAVVGLAVTLSTVFPLEVLAEELMRRVARGLS